jgi:hypothetical protein
MLKSTIFTFAVFATSSAFASSMCRGFFSFQEGKAVRDVQDHLGYVNDFLRSVDLVGQSLQRDYVRRPESLARVNAYLEKSVLPLSRNISILKSTEQDSDSTLIRLTQWRDLFRQTPTLPSGITLYHQEWVSPEKVLRFAKAKVLYRGDFVPATPNALQAPHMSHVQSGAWQVLYIMEMHHSVKAVPGRPELQEYILDRGLKMTVVEAQILEGLETMILRVAVENIRQN